jgi:N-carbamoyl-L-amino-acid hydrolase
MRWYEVTVVGEDCHAGSTPMPMRKDALLGAARMIAAINAIGLRHAPLAVATVGLIEARPNSRNVIPGETFFTIDIRHPEDAVLASMEAEIAAELQEIAARATLDITFTRVWNSPPVHFDEACVAAVREGARALGYAHRDIISGAGHDAAYVAAVAPTAMIFVPCERGISHNELEKAEPEHVAAGANVLLRAVLATDARLGERERT